jgi:hypothetical protein
MLRTEGTKLTAAQRRTQINAIALTGGLLLYSDDFAELDAQILREIATIQDIAGACFAGRLIPWDMMNRELPRVLLNTAGYLGVFNMGTGRGRCIRVPVRDLLREAHTVATIWDSELPHPTALSEVWSGARLEVTGPEITVGPLGPYESRLFRFEP